jgi:thiosulfate reductase cytochrome b subunit
VIGCSRRKEQIAGELLRLNRLAFNDEARRVRVRGGRFRGMSHAASLDVLARVDREYARRAALDRVEDAEFWHRARVWILVGNIVAFSALVLVVGLRIDFAFLTPAVIP